MNRTQIENLGYLKRVTEDMNPEEKRRFYLGLVGVLSAFVDRQTWDQAIHILKATYTCADINELMGEDS